MFGFLHKTTHDVSLNRIHATIRIHEGDDALTLKVNADPMRMVAGLNTVQARLKSLGVDSPQDEINGAAFAFAETLFGTEQAKALTEFYHNDAGCVINVCGKCFSEHLARLIARAQKKAK